MNKEAYVVIRARAELRKIHCPSSPWVFCDRCGDRIACVKKSFASACRKAGLEDFHEHDLRHTCAAWLVQAGVPLIQVRELLRHSAVRMTERYAHLALDNVRAAVAVLDRASSRFGHVGVTNKSGDIV